MDIATLPLPFELKVTTAKSSPSTSFAAIARRSHGQGLKTF